MIKYIFIFLASFILYSCQDENKIDNPTVEVRKIDDTYVLFRHGEPYYIKGAAGQEQLEKLALYGGNSIRTWTTQGADSILDEAHKYGLTVTLGLEVGREFWGKNFNYWNFKAVDQKIEELKDVVEKFKDHPALLMWGVGNEVTDYGDNSLIVYYIINRIAEMIHEIDPNHPTMTAVPLGENASGYKRIKFLCPNIDILGVNGFKNLPVLSKIIRNPFGWNRAYIFSEWGPPGPWEVKDTYWGAPIEQSSSEKAKYIDYCWDLIKNDNFCLGSYAFYWGNKYERTYTFLNLFPHQDLEIESVNVLRNKWTGFNNFNWAPRINSLKIMEISTLENIYLDADSEFHAKVYSSDLDGDSLSFHWEIRPEGKDNYIAWNYEINLNHLIIINNESTIKFNSPVQEGPYRLIAFIYDGNGNVATHNKPFYVIKK